MNATARPACAPVRASSAVLPRRGPVARRLVLARSSDRGPGFTTGFVIGGILFGAIGVIFAPQVTLRWRADLASDACLLADASAHAGRRPRRRHRVRRAAVASRADFQGDSRG